MATLLSGTSRNVPSILGFVSGLIIFPKYHVKPRDRHVSVMFPPSKVTIRIMLPYFDYCNLLLDQELLRDSELSCHSQKKEK